MRQQRPRGATRREAVVDAALNVVDDVGVDGLTIRAVAAIVGAPPMSLYSHFANKEGLLDLMYAELSRRLYPDSGQATWQAELSTLAFHIRKTLLAHPRWTPLLSRPAPPASVPVRERVLTLMVDAGIPAEQALSGMSSTILVALGLTLVELNFLEPDGESTLTRRFDRLKATLAEEPAGAREPTTRAAVAGPARFDFEKTFQVSLETLIRGFAVSMQRPADSA
jgi:TetR/AcrR family transcriptional regulator, tetracycline repressor protein